jgi:hypothetical protein
VTCITRPLGWGALPCAESFVRSLVTLFEAGPVPAPLASIGPTILVVDDERRAAPALPSPTVEGYAFEAATSARRSTSPTWHYGCPPIMPDVVAVGRLAQLGRSSSASPLRLMYMSAYPAEILVQHGLTDPQVHFRRDVHPRRPHGQGCHRDRSPGRRCAGSRLSPRPRAIFD